MTEIDKQIAQEAFFEKYRYISVEDFEALMKEAYESIMGKISGYDNITDRRLKRILLQIEEEYTAAFGKAEDAALNEVQSVAALYLASESKILEQKFSTKLLDEVFNFENDIIEGYSFSELFSATNQQAIRRSKRIIARNLMEGRNPKDFAAELYRQGVTVSKKQLQTNVRTYVKHLREKIKTETEKQIKGLTGRMSLATLDSRTTPVCISLDKEFYPVEEFKTRADIPNKPPRHFNCRSIIVRVTDNTSMKRPARGDEGGEQVDTRTTFNSFLKRNPKTAEKLLGKKKYELWKSGKYDINDFIADDGTWFTLEELKSELT